MNSASTAHKNVSFLNCPFNLLQGFLAVPAYIHKYHLNIQ